MPLFFSTDSKVDDRSLKEILALIKYKEHNWKCDLKVVRILCGLKAGRANFMCFKCNWNSRAGDGWEVLDQPEPNPDMDPEQLGFT